MENNQNPDKYDVAISFLVQDVALAQALYEKLCEGLRVFFFPRNQEELAGTDGMESMRSAFRTDALLNVVLYRERWGQTPWTAVEAAAVKDSCLATAFRSLFFFVVEPTSKMPEWLPDTHVRFNYGDFTLDQAIGAIKMRVQERGGHFVPMTPAKRVEILKAEDTYRYAKSGLNTEQGLFSIVEKVKALFEEIARHCQEVNDASGNLIEHEINFEYRKQLQSCVLRSQTVSMIVAWRQPYSNSLEHTGLFVQEFNGRRLFDSELGRLMQLSEPERISESQYEPELSRSRDLGWKPKNHPDKFLSSASLAEKCVIQFVDLIDRYNAGKIKRMAW